MAKDSQESGSKMLKEEPLQILIETSEGPMKLSSMDIKAMRVSIDEGKEVCFLTLHLKIGYIQRKSQSSSCKIYTPLFVNLEQLFSFPTLGAAMEYLQLLMKECQQRGVTLVLTPETAS